MPLPKAMLPYVTDLNPRADEGIDVEIEDEEPLGDIRENADGSADVLAPEEEVRSPDFMENLAEVLDPGYLNQFGTELHDLIMKDVEDRKKRDEQYADGIRRTGLGNDAPGGAEFQGSSKVVHPMLAKGSIDFASRAIKELFPAGGPCKTFILGEQDEDKLDRAERKKKYMNWQCTDQIEENRAELERILSQVPLGGAQYKRWWWDPELKRPRTEAVFIDDVFMPYGYADFYTTPRLAFRQMITKEKYDERVRTGLYRENASSADTASPITSDISKARTASDKVEGVDPSNALVYNEDGLRLVWQIEILHNEEEDPYTDRPAPYVIHLDDSSCEILGMFRNWDETDDRMRKKHWMTEWSFIPWRGGPAIGLAHLIGSLAAAATGSLRAILDAAHIQSFPGAVKLKGTRGAGESKQISPTEIMEIDAPANTDDIRKAIMPFPFNGPSVVLFQVMEWLTQQAEMVVATASEKIADASNNMPVGTALALIEHGSTNFSAVHARLHASLKRDLQILHRLNAENMEDEETVEELGELIVKREDFLGPMDIVPVSDPNIFSEAQRYAQLQAVIQLKADPQFVQFFKPEALLGRALKLLNIPDIDGIANLPKETENLTPYEENYALAMKERPLKVYRGQDDISHLKSHCQFATSPMFGANPLIAPNILPGMLEHCKEHIMALYRKHTEAAIESFQAVANARGMSVSDEKIQVFAGALVDQALAEQLGPMVFPALEKMQAQIGQIAEASAPKPSPEVALQVQMQRDVGMADVEAKKWIAQQNTNFKTQQEMLNKQISDMDRESQERLAQLATSVEMIRDEQKAGSNQALAEFKAQADLQLSVITTVLTAALTGTETSGEDGSVTKSGGLAEQMITPLVGSIQSTLNEAFNSLLGSANPLTDAILGLAQQQQNFQQALQAQAQSTQQAFNVLAQGLASLVNSESEIYQGPDGVRRARRVPSRQLPPPPVDQGMQP